jgi:hypothetical protein
MEKAVTNEPERFTGGHLEADVVDGGHRRARTGEGDGEVLNVEKRSGHQSRKSNKV